MRNRLALPLVLMLFFASCYDNPDIYQEREKRLLQQYLEQNNITVAPRASGLYYIPVIEGTGLSAATSDYVMLEYTAQLIDGRIFDTTDEALALRKGIFKAEALYGPSKVKLEALSLKGIEEALLLMKEGGEARLIIPSSLAYGGSQTSNVPAFSTLIYDIKLVKVIKDPEAYELQEIEDYLALYQDSLHLEIQTFVHEVLEVSYEWYYIELLPGEGDSIPDGSTLQVFYDGKLVDGRQFDSNFGRAALSVTLGTNQVVTGFELGLKEMKEKGKARIIMPSSLGYGVPGSGNKIPPYSPLVFDVFVDLVLEPIPTD
jgi:FKBP-type peptidyl-prolyl cis-trans isomerase